ncbi:MAG: ATP-binding cassette domain-containing protein [Acidobacteria bacterium]|nr:ATP-binding cassette domain-containing protein [Acidobacteriota bacterium]
MEAVARRPAVEFDRVTLRFEGKVVLRELSFALESGETKVILGATGSGKSVLLKLTMGLLQPNSGRIFVLDREITGLSEEELFPVRQQIGMVFQEGALFDSLTVAENVGYVFERMPQVSPEEAERRVSEALRFVELEHTLELYPSQLSGGMRRRVAIARALVGQPPILLYDSPTAGLDPITASRIMTLVVKQRDVAQISSLLVTHRVQDAFWMANHYYDPNQEKLLPVGRDGARRETHTRFLVLREGESAFHGSLAELEAQRDPYLQKFLA